MMSLKKLRERYRITVKLFRRWVLQLTVSSTKRSDQLKEGERVSLLQAQV